MELLAPAGGMEQLRAAVAFGADAVYLAAERFGMRARAANFRMDEIPAAVAFAHEHGVKVHVTCNILMHPDDIDGLPAFFRALDAAGVDAFIIGDLGAFAVAGEVSPRVERHVSTQASVANAAAARVWHSLGASRVVCAREMSLADIARLRKKTAFVFQNYNLFRNKTALQNVTEGLVVARKMPKAEADAIGRKMLAKVGLADRADAYPRQLSGGQQQRVAIARALATDPEIIYFDEPTSALDPELTGEVLSVMRQLAEEGMTMLVVTHEMGFARNVSSKTVFMENGVVVEQAPSQEFFANPKEERTREFLQKISQHA